VELRFGGRPFPPEAGSDFEPERQIGRRPSLVTPWRIEGLLSLHVQGRRQELARRRGQGRLPKLILAPKEAHEQATCFPSPAQQRDQPVG
jgi:hypothetical protein